MLDQDSGVVRPGQQQTGRPDASDDEAVPLHGPILRRERSVFHLFLEAAAYVRFRPIADTPHRLHASTMRTASPEYLVAHACFACRKSWKVRKDISGGCPQCGGALHEMGRSFKAPKKSDAEQWEKVIALWSAGFRFWSYRSHPDAEPLPERLREVEAFVACNPNHPLRMV